MSYNIMLVDDHPIFRVGLKQVLNAIPEFKVTTDSDNPQDAWDNFQKEQIDLVVTDLSFQDDSGIFLLSSIRNSGSNCPILVLSMLDELFWAERIIQEGANGYIMKNKDISRCVKHLVSLLRDRAGLNGLDYLLALITMENVTWQN